MKLFSTLLLLGLSAATVRSDVKLPAIFADDMVLQRNKPIPIYGTAKPGTTVTVAFADQTATGVSDQTGNWKVTLAPLPASNEPREMTVTGKAKQLVLKNILVGDVWLASGQSNMAMQVHEVFNAKQELEDANYPNIRFFQVKLGISSTPQTKANGSWKTCTPTNARHFSAAAYFFAREIAPQFNIPIGIINSSVGSSAAESWVPMDVLRANPDFPQPLPQLKPEEYPDLKTYNEVRMKNYNDGIYKDPGIKPECLEWAKPDFDDSAWKTMEVPASIKQRGVNIDGTVWFRATADLPKECAGKQGSLNLSFVQQRSIAYVNGIELGRKSNDGRDWVPHNYTIPKGILKEGANTIAVRITVEIGHGGFYPPYPRPLTLACGKHHVLLPKAWKYQVEAGRKPQKLERELPNCYGLPGGHFNDMINPYIQSPLTGFLWYQGESNAGRCAQHDKLFPALINSWRKLWNDDTLPFYFVQLPNYQKRQAAANEHGGWALFRESQEKTLANVPNTGMAITIDIGEHNNVHPRNKQDVGKRLALWAIRDIYGDKNTPACGPIFKNATVEGDKIRVGFNYAYEGLKCDDDQIKGFAIAGEDRKFVWANAKIDGQDVIVWADEIQQPKFVRYAWANNPECNLKNSANLPAGSFRTDK